MLWAESVFKILTEKYFFYIHYRGRLSYTKALYKRKLISIKKWLPSTNYKKVSVLWSPYFWNLGNLSLLGLGLGTNKAWLRD